jgi:surfeit locus 1 family protein
MLNNKNNKISPLISMLFIPLQGYNKSWFINFKPLYSLIMFLGISICVAAAAWQYQKSMFFLAPVAQQVHMEGRYLNELTHYLDNQTLDGKAGYAVITPFAYEDTVYLVNRGFVSFKSRDKLPLIKPVFGTTTIEGLLLTNRKPMLLNSQLLDPLEKRIQFIDKQYFSNKTKKNVSEDIFHLKSGDGLLAMQPVKAPYLSHHRHKAYALQWILLALSGVIILFVSSISRGKSL